MTQIEYMEVCEHLTTAESFGYVVCRKCGLALDRIITDTMTTSSSEFNYDSKQYVEIMHPLSFGTFIGGNKLTLRDYKKKQVDSKWKNLKKTHYLMINNGVLRSHDHSLGILDKICSALFLPEQTKQLAIYYYRKIRKEEKKISKKINGPRIMLCSVLYAINSRHPHIERKTIERIFCKLGYERYVKNIYRVYRQYHEYFPKSKVTAPEVFLDGIIDKIVADPSFTIKINKTLLIKTSYAILSSLSSAKRSGKKPIVLAATAIFLLNKVIPGLKLTKKLTSKCSNITPTSILNTLPLFNLIKIGEYE